MCNGSSNPVPIAEFTESCTDLVCSFDGANSFDDGTIVSYEWDFGDGTVASGVNTNHSYLSAGTYTVSLTVTDDLGAMDTASLGVTVVDGTSGGLDPINEVIPDVSIDRRSYKRFEVKLEDGYSNFTVTTSGGTGNLALYVRPSSGPAACKSRTAGNDETCVVSNPAGGTWYIDLVSGAASSGITLEYTATP
ncbi:PKD domain-containing protein [Paraglaciecola sp.]|uniref:PKD domain-containing protein n=1 Tax=Paraglaciecola sp. TaxID=1920173 RepID=UPI00387EA3EC